MNQRLFFVLLILSSFFLGACAQTPVHKGIELGNPDGEILPIKVTPMTGAVTYELVFREENLASVVRLDNIDTRETVEVEFARNGSTLIMNAVFSGPETVEFIVLLDEEGRATEGTLKINGQSIPAIFATLPQTSPESGKENNALQESDALLENQDEMEPEPIPAEDTLIHDEPAPNEISD